MTPRQRFHAALDLEAPDRTPLFFQHLGAAKWLLQETGLRILDGFHDPEVFARLSLAARDMYDFDNVMIGWGDILIEAQAHGMQWKFPERDFYPRPDKYVEMSEIDSVQPIDPIDDPFWSVPLKAGRLIMDKIGKEVAVVGCINSPNLVASEVVGMENLMMSYFTEPDGAVKLLGTITQSSAAYGERLKEIGIEEVFIENATAGGEMVDKTMYEQFDRKYLQETMDGYRANGLRTILHNCSEKPLWESQMETNPTAFHFQVQAVDLQDIFSALKGKCCVMAGIDSRELLLNRTPEEVEAEVKRVQELWGSDPGFMIAPGCEMPYKVPVENIKRLRESVERYGQMS